MTKIKGAKSDRVQIGAVELSIFSIGRNKICRKKLTTIPVHSAAMIVPSLVPTTLKLKNRRERRRANITQHTSKPILMLPKLPWLRSEIAFTNASPEFMITLAMTDRAMPKPRTIVPSTMNNRRIY